MTRLRFRLFAVLVGILFALGVGAGSAAANPTPIQSTQVTHSVEATSNGWWPWWGGYGYGGYGGWWSPWYGSSWWGPWWW
ncbi:hypothetical protein ACFQX7_09260 [Luedemannella flava]